MPYNSPDFPDSVWDGLTLNRNRVDLNSNVDPNSDDWEKIAAEVISMQVHSHRNRIVVSQASDLENIDSTKEYFLDGIIDMGTASLIIPTTGITLKGYSFDLSGLISTEDNHTLIKSETSIIGSGNILGSDFFLTASGSNSKVYDITDATGFNAFEFLRVNYNDCTSLGDIYNYRQGLELGTGRFGGSPSLTLHGTWVGGYRITTSIVRSLAAGMTEPLFKAGTAFSMASRFLTDINCDLPASAAFCDFAPSNFPNPSTVQVKGAIFSRDGVFDAGDSNIFSNLAAPNLPCDWDNNVGVNNTFVGGTINCSAEGATTIAGVDTITDLLGTFATSDLQHFDSPSSGQLRHIGLDPREFTVVFDFVLEGGANDSYKIHLYKYDGATATSVYTSTRVVNNLQGGSRDVAYFDGQTAVTLDQNDYVYWRVENLTDASNCTLELDSAWSVRER